ncbi:hypothetical protein T459_31798 [Capsicum annuum]|uniref:FAR1 domain-containing protein n=1 Tax=Capsicum annuum TaxID=4072 RepID=A0A2G2Y3W3_CAPAN|nr:hypothetical protein T459_31798 [Capsicum annuum]
MYEIGQIVSNPYIDKEFQSLDDSFKFYLDYAHHTNFNKSIIGQEFLCSKEEFRSKKDLERNKSQDETREGCKALLYISKK